MIAWLLFASTFTGPQACAPCHAEIYKRQSVSHHANALRPVSSSPFIAKLAPLRERGGASLRYEGFDAIADVAGESARLTFEWVFGAGAQAYTPMGRGFVEHRVSWYRRRDGLALTPGHDPNPSRDAQSALGIVQTSRNAYRCFNCHATNVGGSVDAGPKLEEMIPGVTCERCHGPARTHIDAATANRPVRGTILNAGRMTPRQQSEVCAECHRSPDAEFKSDMPELENPVSIRFAPVGLTASLCYQKSGGLSCLTCHNPHEDRRPDAKACITCHTKPHNTGNCFTCHMKQSEGSPFLVFTDHRIRVYPPE